MARKKYIRRRIVKLSTLGEHFPIDIDLQMKEILAKEQARYKYVRFGLTIDLKAEYDKETARRLPMVKHEGVLPYPLLAGGRVPPCTQQHKRKLHIKQ